MSEFLDLRSEYFRRRLFFNALIFFSINIPVQQLPPASGSGAFLALKNNNNMKQKSIEQKIAEVQQYFINKLVEADFEIEDGDQFSLKVLVDGKYKFSIWIANGVDCISAQIGIGAVFMALPEFNSIQKKILYGKIEAEILKYTGIEHHRELLKIQIAELQNKIENLEL